MLPQRLTHGPLVWPLLLALSLLLDIVWRRLGLPASTLMAPMLAGIVVALNGAEAKVPAPFFLFSQGLVGAWMGAGVPVASFERLGASWPIFLGGTFWAMAASLLIGVILAYKRVLPGSTALWGVSPGASAAMVVMSEEYGGDMRLVAFMQYLRIILVSLGTAVAAGLAGADGGAKIVEWFPAFHAVGFATTLAAAGVAVYLGKRFKVPGGAFLTPFIAGFALENSGLLHLELPPWLMLIAYALIGWYTGLKFTRAVLKNAARGFFKITLALVSLIALCGLFSGLMVWVGGLDPLTAYLAASPGGVETVAIIAASANVDVAFVMAMQSFRMILVLFMGPPLTKVITRWLIKKEAVV